MLAPRYRFIPAGSLPTHLRRRLGPAADEASFGAVLVPRHGPEREPLVVGHDVAALLGALQRPGRVPPDISRRFGGAASDVIGGLVLDGVLAIRDGASWVSAADAYGAVIARAPAPRTRGRTARLSEAALRYGAQLGVGDIGVLATRLYRYNTMAASPRWRRLVPSRDVVASWFEHEGGGGSRAWVRDEGVSAGGRWLFWQRRGKGRGPRPRRPVYKLYVSPRSDALRRVLPVLRDELARSDAFALKIGSGVHDLLRPDKIVAYFPDRRALRDAAQRIARRLRGVPAQGVPFTAALAPSGLLSWGIDPPHDQLPPGLGAQGSWRFWVSVRAATALVVASRTARLPVPAWRFALTRLALEGIDVRSFSPVGPRWSAARGA